MVVGFDKIEPKTKKFDQIIAKLKLDKKKLLLLLGKDERKIVRGISNLPYMTSDLVTNLTTYSALNSRTLIFTKESLQCLN